MSSMLSALGGIYSEKLLKGRPSASIHWQNIQLYTWGILFNAVGVFMKDSRRLSARGVLTGYEFWAWSVVLCNALNGLAISAVLKYADNIARVYAHAIAMVVTMLVSVQLFGTHVTPQLVLAVIMVGTSTLQYNLPKVRADTRCLPKRRLGATVGRLGAVGGRPRVRRNERARVCAPGRPRCWASGRTSRSATRAASSSRRPPRHPTTRRASNCDRCEPYASIWHRRRLRSASDRPKSDPGCWSA